MGRSAKQVRAAGPSRPPHGGAAAALGGLISRNPVFVGGATAFFVALSYVSANALWYQPHMHPAAFFSTRDFQANGQPEAGTETTIHLVRPDEAPQRATSDPQIVQVQTVLRDLSFYDGPVDGIAGSNTTKAIERYQQKMGMTVSGRIDAELLDQLNTPPTTAAIAPRRAPRDNGVQPPTPTPGQAGNAAPDELIVKIQAGLKAFGNDGMEIDGVIGSRTKAALREFQSLFGLPETGEPDLAVYAKMKEIGLTN